MSSAPGVASGLNFRFVSYYLEPFSDPSSHASLQRHGHLYFFLAFTMA